MKQSLSKTATIALFQRTQHPPFFRELAEHYKWTPKEIECSLTKITMWLDNSKGL